MKRHGNWVIKVVLIGLSALWLSVVAASWSEAAETDQPRSDDEYNFTWLDPDKKIYVLQNRRYTKANRALITLNAGMADNSAYRTSQVVDPRIAYYFTENWGIEVFYSFFSNKANSTAQALQATSIRPDVIEINNRMGALLHWSPWYAKINVFNWILYFDWYFSGGIGTLNADAIAGGATGGTSTALSKSFTGYFLGTGHQYHLSENFVVRADFTNVWFKAPQRATTGPETLFNATTFELGIGVRL